jgi:hypothetical protein
MVAAHRMLIVRDIPYFLELCMSDISTRIPFAGLAVFLTAVAETVSSFNKLTHMSNIPMNTTKNKINSFLFFIKTNTRIN